jgi:hypothetical protein
VADLLLRRVRAENIGALARDAIKLPGPPPRRVDFREVTDAVRYSYSFPEWALSTG